MKTVVKISDKTCPVCKQLGKVDQQISESFNLGFFEIFLEDLPLHQNLYTHLSENYVDHEGFVDVPIYVVLEEKNMVTNFLGSFVGKPEKSFSDALKEIIQ